MPKGKLVEKYPMRNPLVAMVTIGDYTDREGSSTQIRLRAEVDAKRIKKSCYVKNGYTLMYMENNSTKPTCVAEPPSQHPYTDETNYKIRWYSEEIDDFTNKVLAKLQDGLTDFDGLIYFVSGHGDSEGVFLDSESEEISIAILIDRFSNLNCIALRNKPKIFVFDCCRGPLRNTRRENEKYNLAIVDAQNRAAEKNSGDTDKDKDEKDEDVDDGMDMKMIESKLNVKSGTLPLVSVKESQFFLSHSHNICVYANPDGYAILDGDGKGGYLIKSFATLMNADLPKHKSKDLKTFLLQVNGIMKALQGTTKGYPGNIMEIVTSCPFDVILCSKLQ